MTIEEILQPYPHLRPDDVHDALAYAYDHPEDQHVIDQALSTARFGRPLAAAHPNLLSASRTVPDTAALTPFQPPG